MSAFCVCLVSFFICEKGDEEMQKPLRDQLKQWEKKHKEIIRNNRQKNSKRKSENLSEEDLKDLMGINRPIYRRGKGGAIRRR